MRYIKFFKLITGILILLCLGTPGYAATYYTAVTEVFAGKLKNLESPVWTNNATAAVALGNFVTNGGVGPSNGLDYVFLPNGNAISTNSSPTWTYLIAYVSANGGAFEGNSLALNTNTVLAIKGVGVTNTITNLTLNGGVVLNYDANGALKGDMLGGSIQANAGTLSYFDVGTAVMGTNNTANRTLTIVSSIAGSGDLMLVQGISSGSYITNLDIWSPSNTFSGRWIVRSGWLKGTGVGSLGSNNVSVIVDPLATQTNAYAGSGFSAGPATFEPGYDVSSVGTLIITNGGKMKLHQNCTFNAVNINGIALTNGVTYSYLMLTNMFGTNTFPAGGSGSIILPPSTQFPVVTLQPTNQTIVSGGSVTFAVAANGTAPLGYQWQAGTIGSGVYANLTDSGNISGSASTNLTIANLTPANAADYIVIVTNSYGSVTSAVATLTIALPPSITLQPNSQAVSVGGSAAFTAMASGTAPLGYQWQAGVTGSGIYTNLINGGNISGSTSNTLTVINSTSANSADYILVVTNLYGSATSSVATLMVAYAPLVTVQPVNQTATNGGSATFGVTVIGAAPFSYQWQFNGANIIGATSSSYTLSGATPNNDGAFTVVVTNVYGSVTSSPAALSVTYPNTFFTAVTETGAGSLISIAGAIWTNDPVAAVALQSNVVSNATTPAGGNDYVALSNGQIFTTNVVQLTTVIRTYAPYTFPGNSLTLNTNTALYIKNLAQVSVISNLVMNGGLIQNGNDNTTTNYNMLGGSLQSAPGSLSYFDFGSITVGLSNAANRTLTLLSTVSGSGDLVLVQGVAIATNVDVQSSSNTFSGRWIVRSGYLKGSGMDSLGTNSSIIVDPIATQTNNYFGGGFCAGPAKFEVGYDMNSAGTLTLTNGGSMRLHQNCAFSAVTVNNTFLTNGTYSYLTLSNMFGTNVFIRGGSGYITVRPYTNGLPTVPPFIAAQPVFSPSSTMYDGETVQCKVVPGGPGPFFYQWKTGPSSTGAKTNLIDGATVSGSTTSVLTLSNLGTNNTAYYAVVITNSFGSVTSAVVHLTVNISQHFYTAVTETGVAPLLSLASHIWTNDPAQALTLGDVLTNGSAAATGGYYEALSNGQEFTNVLPEICTVLRSYAAYTFPGRSLQLDTNTVIYIKNTARISTINLILNGGSVQNGDNNSGANHDMLGGSVLANPDTVSYFNFGGVTIGPFNSANRTLTLSSSITGSGDLMLVQGAALSAVNLDIVSTSNNYSGRWIVRSGYLRGTAVESLGTNSSFIVDPLATQTNSYAGGGFCAGPSVFEPNYDLNSAGTLTLNNGGLMVLHQNCAFTAVTIEGFSLAGGTYSYTTLTNMFPDSFEANGGGAITVEAYTNVLPGIPPFFVGQPAFAPVNVANAGQTVSCVAQVGGTAPLSYQWQAGASGSGVYTNVANGGNISGANTASLIISNVTAGNAADYVLVVSNAQGVIASSVVTLTVVPATTTVLSSTWQFSTDPNNVGLTNGWYSTNFDDSGWSKIQSGRSWETQIGNYAGYGWYRQHIFIPAVDNPQETPLTINLSSVYSDDAFYFNGVLCGGITNEYKYTNIQARAYTIQASNVLYGRTNVIAVRIWGGDIGLQGRNSGLIAGTYTAVANPYRVMARAVGDSYTNEQPIELWDLSSAQQGNAFEMVFRIPGAALNSTNVVLSYTVNDFYGDRITNGTTSVEIDPDGIGRGVLSVSAASSQTIYLAGRLKATMVVTNISNGSVLYTNGFALDHLSFNNRDNLELPALTNEVDVTPYGSLTLIDSIDCSTASTNEVHPYMQSAFGNHSQDYSTPGVPINVSVDNILGLPARESAFGWFAYRVGRGLLSPHKTYLLRIEYPEDKPRYCPIEIQAGHNYMDVGWKNGINSTNPYDNWPLSGKWQWYDVMVPVGDETLGSGGAGDASTQYGFWVYFMTKTNGNYFAPYSGGPAVAAIKLYAIDPVTNAPQITMPQGVPQRIMTFDWERQPANVPADLVSYAELMGYNAISPLALKWLYTNFGDPTNGYDSANVDAATYWVSSPNVSGQPAQPAVPGEASVHERYLEATAGTTVNYIPRIEYGGSYNLPTSAWAIGTNGQLAVPDRFANHCANLLNPATFADETQYIDMIFAPYVASNPQLKGALWRIREDTMPASYGTNDIAMFCSETGTNSPTGYTPAQLALWASPSGPMGAAYSTWWQGKRAQYHQQLVSYMRTNYGTNLTLYYYNWDEDKFALMEPDLNSATFYANVNSVGGPTAYANDLAARESYTASQYTNVMFTGDFSGSFGPSAPAQANNPAYALRPSLYSNISGVELFAPVNWLCYAQSNYINYFQTADGLAVANCVSYDEIAAREPNPKYEGNMVLPGGGQFSMALELLSYYYGDARTLTYTVYTYGRGFADAHRRFAQAFLALPAVPGLLVTNTPTNVAAREYPTTNGVYIGIAYKGYSSNSFTVNLPGNWNAGVVVTNLVTMQSVPTSIVSSNLQITLTAEPMEIDAFIVTGPGTQNDFIRSNALVSGGQKPKITAITRKQNGNVTLGFTGTSNDSYVIQVATNLSPTTIWTTISTNTADANGLWQFTDTKATNSQRFYRAYQQ